MAKPILLVEDNEDDEFALKRAFRQQQLDHPLFVVRDGQQAMDYLAGTGLYADRETYPMPAIVFLDLKLPFVSGFDVLAWIRGEPSLASLVVVVLTSSGEPRDVKKAYDLGARSYFIKTAAQHEFRRFLESFESWEHRGAFGPMVVKLAARPV